MQLCRDLKALVKQLEMLLGHELGVGVMAKEVLTAGGDGDGGFAKRTFSKH